MFVPNMFEKLLTKINGTWFKAVNSLVIVLLVIYIFHNIDFFFFLMMVFVHCRKNWVEI
jgi:hypothetical protein